MAEHREFDAHALGIRPAGDRARGRSARMRIYQRNDLDSIPQLRGLPAESLLVMQAVAAVLPFRVNDYVVEELIDWERVPEDPIFQLTFPQAGMLEPADLARMLDLVRRQSPESEVKQAAREIQLALNPHPAGQLDLNVPSLDGRPLRGIQHKYRETVLFFPSQGQTCHAYCSYCFRWPQFVGLDELKFAAREALQLAAYLREHREVSSVLITGGDPLVMKTRVLRRILEPLLAPGLEHVTSIRLGTKSTAWWPQRFTSDDDADDLLRLFESVREAGKHLALMSHYSHPRELETREAQAALRRILATGAVVRCQAPLIRHVNDSASTWADMWRLQVQLGAVPYYMFVERDTGARRYFEVPLAQAWTIFNGAYRRVSGLARTVRGPSMSATPGKVKVCGVTEIAGEKVFVLTFEQARDPAWVGRLFFAAYDPEATWLDQLRPADGRPEFFYERAMREFWRTGSAQAWGDRVPERRKPVLFGHVELN
jgi:KamA family protein